MNINFFKEKVLPHLIAVIIFTILSFVYLSPLLSGDRLLQHDYIQALGQQHEITSTLDSTGHQTLWTNSMFGGMPAVQIWLKYPTNLIGQCILLVQAIFIHEIHLLFLLMLGAYVMAFSLTKNTLLGIIAAVALAFGSFNLVSIEAGHLNKILAIAFVAPILGGLIVAYRGRWLTGGAIFAVFLTLQLRSNHFQITYYTLIASLILGLYALIETGMKKELPLFAKATGMLAVAAVLALLANTTQLWGTWEYSKATIRGGGSELTSNKTESPSGGLDTAYAFSYSEGIDEVMTIMIPNFKGGGQMQSYSGTGLYNKVTENVMQSRHLSQDKAEKMVDENYRSVYYWGGGGFSAGPIYFGAIVCFLFVLGMFIIRSNIKWALLAITLIAFMLAWGKNFSSLNYFLFSHLPMYNKFRTPSMTMSIANIMFVLVSTLALKEVLDNTWSKDELIKRLKYAAGVTVGILVLFGFVGSAFYNYHGDPGFEDQLSKADILSDVLADRKSLLLGDAFRSLVFILLGIGLVWTYVTQKIKLKANYFLGALAILILVDLWAVDKRCFNDDAFVSETEFNKNFQPKQVDLAILQDKDLSYRVLDERTGDPFTNAKTSYFHKSIGGYHAAKLRIYQELIENQLRTDIGAMREGLSKGIMVPNLPALNMLNARYIVFGDSVQQLVRNPGALGNAWFVNDIKSVNTADEEMAALATLNPKTTAVVRATFKDQVGSLTPSTDSTATISLTNYKPDELSYTYHSGSPRLAVFSEVYYLDGKDWHAFVDGKPAPHLRANYVLRAMALPAGDHKVTFKFEPPFYTQGNIVSLIGSLLIISLIAASIYFGVKGKSIAA